MTKKKPSKIIIFGAAAAALILVVVVAVVLNVSGGNKEYDSHLEMARKYLNELDYEQAVVELRIAIEIEPNDSAAYLALAEVYVAMGDYENALAVLEEGYAVTGDTELSAERERIAGEYAQFQEQQKQREQEQIEQEQREQEQRVQEFYEKYADLLTFAWDAVYVGDRAVSDKYLTYAQREQAYGGVAEWLEQYLVDLDEIEGLPEELYDVDWERGINISYFTKRGAYECLADTYLHMGKLEECLRVRTEWAEFCDRPDLVQDGNHGYYEDVEWEYDKYGRETSYYHDTYEEHWVYGEFYDGTIHYTRAWPGYLEEYDYTHDSEGRMLHRRVSTSENEGVVVLDNDYAYSGNNSVVVTGVFVYPDGSTSTPGQWEIFYDEYGREIFP